MAVAASDPMRCNCTGADQAPAGALNHIEPETVVHVALRQKVCAAVTDQKPGRMTTPHGRTGHEVTHAAHEFTDLQSAAVVPQGIAVAIASIDRKLSHARRAVTHVHRHHHRIVRRGPRMARRSGTQHRQLLIAGGGGDSH